MQEQAFVSVLLLPLCWKHNFCGHSPSNSNQQQELWVPSFWMVKCHEPRKIESAIDDDRLQMYLANLLHVLSRPIDGNRQKKITAHWFLLVKLLSKWQSNSSIARHSSSTLFWHLSAVSRSRERGIRRTKSEPALQVECPYWGRMWGTLGPQMVYWFCVVVDA